MALQPRQRLGAFLSPRCEIPRARVGTSAPGAHEAPGTLTRIQPVELLASGLERGEVGIGLSPGPAGSARNGDPAQRGPRGAGPLAPEKHPPRRRRSRDQLGIEREIEDLVPPPEPLGLQRLPGQQRLKPSRHGVRPLQLSTCLLRRANPPPQKRTRDREAIGDPGVAQRAHSSRDELELAIRFLWAAFQLLFGEKEPGFQFRDRGAAALKRPQGGAEEGAALGHAAEARQCFGAPEVGPGRSALVPDSSIDLPGAAPVGKGFLRLSQLQPEGPSQPEGLGLVGMHGKRLEASDRGIEPNAHGVEPLHQELRARLIECGGGGELGIVERGRHLGGLFEQPHRLVESSQAEENAADGELAATERRGGAARLPDPGARPIERECLVVAVERDERVRVVEAGERKIRHRALPLEDRLGASIGGERLPRFPRPFGEEAEVHVEPRRASFLARAGEDAPCLGGEPTGLFIPPHVPQCVDGADGGAGGFESHAEPLELDSSAVVVAERSPKLPETAKHMAPATSRDGEGRTIGCRARQLDETLRQAEGPGRIPAREPDDLIARRKRFLEGRRLRCGATRPLRSRRGLPCLDTRQIPCPARRGLHRAAPSAKGRNLCRRARHARRSFYT